MVEVDSGSGGGGGSAVMSEGWLGGSGEGKGLIASGIRSLKPIIL